MRTKKKPLGINQPPAPTPASTVAPAFRVRRTTAPRIAPASTTTST